MADKIYYSVYTTHEKIWIRADTSEIVGGCLVFYDIEEGTKMKVLIAAFPEGYWKYVYEADPESGESINEQIPFWKKHPRHDVDTRGDNRPDHRQDNAPKVYTSHVDGNRHEHRQDNDYRKPPRDEHAMPFKKPYNPR